MLVWLQRLHSCCGTGLHEWRLDAAAHPVAVTSTIGRCYSHCPSQLHNKLGAADLVPCCSAVQLKPADTSRCQHFLDMAGLVDLDHLPPQPPSLPRLALLPRRRRPGLHRQQRRGTSTGSMQACSGGMAGWWLPRGGVRRQGQQLLPGSRHGLTHTCCRSRREQPGHAGAGSVCHAAAVAWLQWFLAADCECDVVGGDWQGV